MMKANENINVRIINELKENALLVKKQAVLGGWEGRGWIKDDFNEPMDEYGRFASDVDYCKPVREVWDNGL